MVTLSRSIISSTSALEKVIFARSAFLVASKVSIVVSESNLISVSASNTKLSISASISILVENSSSTVTVSKWSPSKLPLSTNFVFSIVESLALNVLPLFSIDKSAISQSSAVMVPPPNTRKVPFTVTLSKDMDLESKEEEMIKSPCTVRLLILVEVNVTSLPFVSYVGVCVVGGT